jgi:hypothetical protein
MELPLIATGGVRSAPPDDALATRCWRRSARTRTEGVLGHPGLNGYDLPTLTVEETRTQEYLKSPQQIYPAILT